MAEWFRLDSRFHANPKWAAVPRRQAAQARILYVALIGWANEHETNGWVRPGVLKEIGRSVDVPRPGPTISHLIAAGLVHDVDEPAELELVCLTCSRRVGDELAASSRLPTRQFRPERRLGELAWFYIHGFLDRQYSREWWEAKRLRDNQRQRDARARRSDGQQQLDVSQRDTPPPDGTLSQRDGHYHVTQPTEQTEDLKALSFERFSDARDPDHLATAETATPEDRLTAGAQAPSLRAQVDKLTGADRGTWKQLGPQLEQLPPDDARSLIAEAAAAPLPNQAGLLHRRINDHLHELRRSAARRSAAEHASPDAAGQREHELTAAERIQTYAESLARHQPGVTVAASIDTIARRIAPHADETQLADLIAAGVAAHTEAHHQHLANLEPAA